MLWDDGTEDTAFFAVGSEETVLSFGYEGHKDEKGNSILWFGDLVDKKLNKEQS